MRRDLDDIATRFPGYYRHDLLQYRIKAIGCSKLEVGRRAKVKPETLRRVLAGIASTKTVRKISDTLGVDWAMLHNLELKKSEFHLACAERGGSER